MEDQNDKPEAEEPEEKFMPVPAKTPEELKEIAMGLIENRYFCDLQLKQSDYVDMLPHVFIPIALGAFRTVDLKTLGMIYASWDDRLDRAINGYPIFHACHLLNTEDAAKVMEMYQRMRAAMEDVAGEKKEVKDGKEGSEAAAGEEH
jgi:hypothetical protein